MRPMALRRKKYVFLKDNDSIVKNGMRERQVLETKK